MGRGKSWTTAQWTQLMKFIEAKTSYSKICAQTGWKESSVKKAAARIKKGADANHRPLQQGKHTKQQTSGSQFL